MFHAETVARIIEIPKKDKHGYLPSYSYVKYTRKDSGALTHLMDMEDYAVYLAELEVLKALSGIEPILVPALKDAIEKYGEAKHSAGYASGIESTVDD